MNAHPRTEFAELMERAGLDIDTAAELLGVSDRTIRRNMKGEGRRTDQLRLEKLRQTADARCTGARPEGFRFIDLFAGIGGIRLPFEAIDGRCVFTAEWDRFSRETYSANFPEPANSEHIFAEDVRPYADAPEKIPAHDVLLAGFPCQPFSIAGVSKKNALGRPHGFLCDTQGTLFYDLAKIMDYHQPPAFLLENVKNLERHDGGKTFATIIHVLENELGYRVFHNVISSTPWVPQKRERIFIVGFKDHSIGFDFGQLAVPEGDGPTLGSILDKKVDPKYTLTEHMWNYLQGYKEKHRKAGNGFGFSLFGPNDVARTLSARYYKDGSEILIAQKGNRPRRLTPRECARLMGFEKPGKTDWQIPVSDTQGYRQFGNAVVVPVVNAVAQLMQPRIIEAMDLDGREVPQTVQVQLPPARAGYRCGVMPADSVTAATRSRMMAGIKGKNTKPELAVRSALHRRGFRFRLHRKDLPGKPDLVFTGRNAVIFVHGCFWHGHDCHLFRWPKSREAFWRNKIGANIERDRRQYQTLTATGWRIGTVWECALKGKTRLPFDGVVDQCAIWLKSDIKILEVRGDAARATV